MHNMTHRTKWTALLLLIQLLLLTSSCSSDDDQPYPSIVTEMADLLTNDKGYLSMLRLDDGTRFSVTNNQGDFANKALYRVLCGYTAEGASATIYQLTGAYILRDSSQIAQRDPVAVRSVWRTPRYINLHLAPKTQGGNQYWGFITDSIQQSITSEGDTLTHAYLSLHHKQNADPASYTEETYASIPLDSVKGIKAASPITLSICTEGGKTQNYEL